MLVFIVAAVAGAIGALAAVATAFPPPGIYLTGTAGFLFVLVMMGFWSRISYKRASRGVQPRFACPRAAEGN
jgi:preprotein translocase subunit SecY